MNNFNRTIVTAADATAAYNAVTTGFEHWWTKPEGVITQPGDRAKFTFPPGISYWTFEAITLEPYRYVELKCVEALHKHEGQPREIETEWLGTHVIWRIEEDGGKTAIHLDHVGLGPDLLCYDICRAGWDHFFMDSLKAYLDTGTGTPHEGAS